MNRPRKIMKSTILAGIALAASQLSGCSFLQVGESEYSCKGMPEGVTCMSARDVYQMTENENFRKQIDEDAAIKKAYEEGDEDAQSLVKLEQVGVHHQLDAGHQGRDDHHIDRNPNFVGHPVAHQRDGQIAHHQDGCGGDTKPQSIGRRGSDGQRWAQAEDLHQGRVIFPKPLLGDVGQQAVALEFTHGVS